MWRNSGRVDFPHLRISKSLFTRHAYLLSLTYRPVCGEDILKTWIIFLQIMWCWCLLMRNILLFLVKARTDDDKWLDGTLSTHLACSMTRVIMQY